MPRSRATLAAAVVVACCTAVLAAGPALFDSYWLRVLTGVFMFATAAQALNIIAGYTGYPAFGNVVFFGIGAYWTGVLMVEYGVVFPLALAWAANDSRSRSRTNCASPPGRKSTTRTMIRPKINRW